MALAPPLIVDARGMRCPWPALRLARAMRTLPADGTARLLADDPAAASEVAALAAEHGWRVIAGAPGLFEVRQKTAREWIVPGEP